MYINTLVQCPVHRATVSDAKLLTASLFSNQVSLDIELNPLSSVEMQLWAEGLTKNSALSASLRTLNLSNIRSGSDLQPLFGYIAGTTTLQHLHFRHNCLQRPDCGALAVALECNRSLQYLDIDNNGIQMEGMWPICTSLAYNTCLKFLRLGQLKDVSSHRAVAHLLVRNKALQRLEVSSLWDYTHVLQGLARNKSLLSLQLTGNIYNETTLNALAATLRVNVSLTDIDAPGFSRGGAKALTSVAEVLAENARHQIRVSGVRFCRVLDSIINPGATTQLFGKWYTDECSDDDVCMYLLSKHSDKALAFAMGQHLPSNRASVLSSLSHDNLRMIVSSFFGLPFNYFYGPRKTPAYVDILREVRNMVD